MSERRCIQYEALEVDEAILEPILITQGLMLQALLSGYFLQQCLPCPYLLIIHCYFYIFSIEEYEKGSKLFALYVLVGGLDQLTVHLLLINLDYKPFPLLPSILHNPAFLIAKQALPYFLIMIRNRYPLFLQQRRQRRPSSQGGQSASSLPLRPPIWQQDYYHYKSQLSDVGSTNRDIHSLLEHFHANPSLYNIRALERMLETNCKRINEIQNWVSHFPFSREPEAAVQLERNMVRHFQSSVLSHINSLFMFKGRLTHLIDERNSMENSFSALNNSNISNYSVNKSVHDRGESIREVSAQIQALNSILRRMGDIVATQGDLINRIDQNLNEGVDHISQGRAQLGERLEQERGEGEFSCSGKINKAIMVLYVINIVLIFILVIKNI